MDSPLGYYNPNLRKQGAKSRKLAAERSAEATASRNPKTVGALKGLLQENPYEDNPLSVLDPKRQQVTETAAALYPIGMAFNLFPGSGLFKKGKKTVEATKEGTGTLDKLNNAQMSRRGFLKAASSPLVASAIGETSSFLPPIETLVTQSLPEAAIATTARSLNPLSATALAKAKNALPHIAERVDRTGFDALNRSDYLDVIKPEGMSRAEFIRTLKANHPEEYRQVINDIDRLQKEFKWTAHGHNATKEEYLKDLSSTNAGAAAREARLWDASNGTFLVEPKSYLPEKIPYRAFELEMADQVLEKLPKSKGGALAALPDDVKNRLFLPFVGKAIPEVKSLMSSLQQTLPIEIAQLKDSKATTTKMLEHFSQDPEKLLAQAQTITTDTAPKEVMSAFKQFDTDTLLSPRELAIKQTQDVIESHDRKIEALTGRMERELQRKPTNIDTDPEKFAAKIKEQAASTEDYIQKIRAERAEDQAKLDQLLNPKPSPTADPFWFNAKTGAHAPMSVEDIHAQKIQDPAYAAQLGVTPEQATAYPLAPEAEPLITGRQTDNRLSLVGMGTPTDETLAATQKMLQEKQYAPEVLDFGGGERLWEGMTTDDLLKAKSLQDLEPFKKYKAGGEVKLSRYSKQHIAMQHSSRK